jgi:hypothetical protein
MNAKSQASMRAAPIASVLAFEHPGRGRRSAAVAETSLEPLALLHQTRRNCHLASIVNINRHRGLRADI